jgi:Fe-S-cluster-containing dehydrogenase component
MSAGPGEPTVPPAFLHDLNTCVGCHACAIACINEHQLAPGRFWRQVVTFNAERRPQHPTYHLSLACNHCLDAPCVRACPSGAIARDAGTGAVLIHADRCVGCRYCSWACPYDAPRFDTAAGVMQKCTLCAHRLAQELLPACVSQCPTGALRLEPYDTGGLRHVVGFPQFPARPAIGFVPLRRRAIELDATDLAASFDMTRPGPSAGPLAMPPEVPRASPLPRKISLRSEWALATFTFIAIVLAAWEVALRLGGPAVRAAPLLALAVAATALSTTHLGQPRRAWRAALNWRQSWLSREVIAFPAFVALAAAATWLPEISVAAAVAGGVLVVCVDRVYSSAATRRDLGLDRYGAMTSAAFLAGVFSGTGWLVAAGGTARLAAAAIRPFSSRPTWSAGRRARALLRVALGFGAPCAIWLAGGDAVLAAALALVGEALDRADVYDAIDIVTPALLMAEASAEERA